MSGNESKNLKIWDSLKTVPDYAQKKITGGRLKGMTDIRPQWRFLALTEQFGPCGQGWRYTIEKLWTEEGAEGQIFAFAQVNIYTAWEHEGEIVWSQAIPGIGGSMLIEKQKDRGGNSYLYCNDEAFKMAATDAISVAAKALGVGADVYMGHSDSKYRGGGQRPQQEGQSLTDNQKDVILKAGKKNNLSQNEIIQLVEWKAKQLKFENMRDARLSKYFIGMDKKTGQWAFEKTLNEYLDWREQQQSQ